MTDAAFLLHVLADGKPHSLTDILARSFAERGHGLTVHSRAADLRRRGHIVDVSHVSGAKRGQAWVYVLRAASSDDLVPPFVAVGRGTDGTAGEAARSASGEMEPRAVQAAPEGRPLSPVPTAGTGEPSSVCPGVLQLSLEVAA